MFNFTTIARQALLACALVFCSGAALAGPTYLVTIHTEAYSGESGLLDFGLLGYDDAPGAFAALSNFSGAFGEEFDRAGTVSGDLASGLMFTTGGVSNYLTQAVVLGGDLGFTLHFGGDYETIDSLSGINFAIVLYDASMTEMWDVIAQFELVPSFAGTASSVVISPNDALVTVSDVPEPSQLLLMLSALVLAGVALRRKHGA